MSNVSRPGQKQHVNISLSVMTESTEESAVDQSGPTRMTSSK
jgi:hypothetical protein